MSHKELWRYWRDVLGAPIITKDGREMKMADFWAEVKWDTEAYNMTTDEWDMQRLKEIRDSVYDTLFKGYVVNDITEELIAKYVIAFILLQMKDQH